ncbi:MAG: Na(+)/H(+) antiporter subunit B [Blastochloris sp.]|nr:Na(+)/H(+) antiporter subunit B [Blastochloris sp.]
MNNPGSFLLRIATGLVFFVVALFSVYLLLRGHNLPGGGFIGGLAATIGILLHGLAHGFDEMEAQLKLDPIRIAALGLLLAVLTGLAPLLLNRPFFEHYNTYVSVPYLGQVPLGTPLVYDLGIYLLVIGISTKVIFIMARSTSGRCGLLPNEVHEYSSLHESPIEETALTKEDNPHAT